MGNFFDDIYQYKNIRLPSYIKENNKMVYTKDAKNRMTTDGQKMANITNGHSIIIGEVLGDGVKIRIKGDKIKINYKRWVNEQEKAK